MRLRHRAIKLLTKINNLPKYFTIPVGVLMLLASLYGVVFGIPKHVAFSYAATTCVRQLTLFPALHRSQNEAPFEAYTSNSLGVGNFKLATFSMCFKPREAPRPGVIKVATSPFGGWFAKKTFAVTVPQPVIANVSQIRGPVPVSKALKVPLTKPDQVFSYGLKLGDKQTRCDVRYTTLLCNIPVLRLEQGKIYHGELIRYFKGKRVALVASKDIQTLSATSVTNTSINPGEIVYAKPKELVISLDKKVISATATLYKIDGDRRTEIQTNRSLVEGGLKVAFKEDLPRSADYDLLLDKVEAVDGSTLVLPYHLAFKVSGGPKVTGVNVGKASVALGSTVVVSFDQPLLEGQDIKNLVSLGGGATLVGKRDNQILISLANVPRCGDFSIRLSNDIQSNYEVAGNSAWSFTSRTICYSIGTIGYSTKGRPINAYYFGSGSRTVLFTGAIHGNEISTKVLMDRWIQDLEANASSIPGDKQVVVVPQINPDGVTAGLRVNGHNVDLNRNFATTDWRTDITDVNNNPFPGGGGPTPMSEPETAAIASLVQRLQPMVVLSYHSVGGLLAANQAGSSGAFAATYSALSGYRNATGQSGTFEYAVSGTADDWYAERLGVASILIELGSSTYSQFERNQRAMWAMVNG